jgi:hypothetical protein
MLEELFLGRWGFMMRNSALVVAAVILVGTGAVHGLLTDRWSFSAEPQASAAKLPKVPMMIGDWQSHPLEISQSELQMGAIVDYVGRIFVNNRTKSRVQIFLVCGRPGPISVHTPDICFEGAGYRMTAAPAKFPLEFNPPDEFWQVKFVKEATEGQKYVRVFWAWNSDGHWQVPENPRWTFARSKALFKLYVVHDLPQPGQPPEKDPSLELMRVLLPELKKCLFSNG